jgi:hypothetical protein
VPGRTTGSPFGALDLALGTAGGVRVAGWVVDPDRPDATAVHVYIDGAFAGAAMANGRRPDVGALVPRSGPAHGYDFTVPAAGGRHEVCVYGINIGDHSPNPGLGCRPVDVPTGNPVGHVDLVSVGPGLIRVAGWTFDPDAPAAPVTVHVYGDDRAIGATVAGGDRPDVGARSPAAGRAHGFDLLAPIPGGTHLLRTFPLDIGAEPNRAIDARWVRVPTGPPIGFVDLVEPRPGGVRVAGWAVDPDTAATVTVHVHADNQPVGAGPAGGWRPDIGAAYPGYGPDHGFDFVVPVTAGSRVISVYGLNLGPPDAPTVLGSRLVAVP